LTQMEFNILLFLANNPEFDTAAQIIKKRAFTKSHVSMSVRSLEERGLLTGEYYGTDRRTIHLKLTDAAAPMVSDGKNVQKRAAEIICRGFTPEEHRMLFELMNRINSNISDYRKEGKLHEQQ
ncbi:MAG TPA: MarR family transcriptional regulator, partial [Lachnoclostridium sp.]|nr:MarR family transcriptional regulator [Lachnoclostridium sp.]